MSGSSKRPIILNSRMGTHVNQVNILKRRSTSTPSKPATPPPLAPKSATPQPAKPAKSTTPQTAKPAPAAQPGPRGTKRTVVGQPIILNSSSAVTTTVPMLVPLNKPGAAPPVKHIAPKPVATAAAATKPGQLLVKTGSTGPQTKIILAPVQAGSKPGGLPPNLNDYYLIQTTSGNYLVSKSDAAKLQPAVGESGQMLSVLPGLQGASPASPMRPGKPTQLLSIQPGATSGVVIQPKQAAPAPQKPGQLGAKAGVGNQSKAVVTATPGQAAAIGQPGGQVTPSGGAATANGAQAPTNQAKSQGLPARPPQNALGPIQPLAFRPHYTEVDPRGLSRLRLVDFMTNARAENTFHVVRNGVESQRKKIKALVKSNVKLRKRLLELKRRLDEEDDDSTSDEEKSSDEEAKGAEEPVVNGAGTAAEEDEGEPRSEVEIKSEEEEANEETENWEEVLQDHGVEEDNAEAEDGVGAETDSG